MNKKLLYIFLSIAAMLQLQGCIHDYPIDAGSRPDSAYASISLEFNLKWERMLHHVDFSTKAVERSHRFIIEARMGDEIYHKEELYLTQDDFLKGALTHKISRPLPLGQYDIAVWYDSGKNEIPLFDVTDFKEVRIGAYTSEDHSETQSGYASAQVDLTKGGPTENAIEKRVDMELRHSGARFEIMATDVERFILDHKAALNQGDEFYVKVILDESAHNCLNLFSERSFNNGSRIEYTSDLWLPFDDYEELRVADGFIFSPDEDTVAAILLVYNSAGMIVAQTSPFSFPVKRGFITVIKGDFLTSSIDSSLKINNIWSGELEIDV